MVPDRPITKKKNLNKLSPRKRKTAQWMDSYT